MLKNKKLQKLNEEKFEDKFMFISKEKLARYTSSFLVGSFLTFLTVMPASAADIQFNSEGNKCIAAQEEVEDDYLYSHDFGFKDDTTCNGDMDEEEPAPIDEEDVDEEEPAPIY